MTPAGRVQIFDFDAPPVLPTLTLTQDRSIADSPTITKLAGTPYLPAAVEYPTYSHGPMTFIAQFNFAELPHVPGFPRTGIMQLFVGADERFGLDDPDGSLVRYIEDVSAPSVGEMPLEAICDDGAFFEPLRAMPLRGHLETMLPTHCSVHIRDRAISGPYIDSPYTFLQRGREMLLLKSPSRYEIHRRYRRPDGAWRDSVVATLNGDAQERLDELVAQALSEGYARLAPPLDRLVTIDVASVAGHRLGGYPYFTQEDPRKPWDRSILLAQLDTDHGITWGDVGVATWFIHPDDLGQRDFSRVRFHWDCA